MSINTLSKWQKINLSSYFAETAAQGKRDRLSGQQWSSHLGKHFTRCRHQKGVKRPTHKLCSENSNSFLSDLSFSFRPLRLAKRKSFFGHKCLKFSDGKLCVFLTLNTHKYQKIKYMQISPCLFACIFIHLRHWSLLLVTQHSQVSLMLSLYSVEL